MATTEQTLTANHNQIIADTISQAFNENSTEIFARQLAAKKLISLSHNLDNAELVKLYQDEADIQIAMARTLLTNQPNRYELDDTTFKTDYKFASKEEKAIYQRFVENHKKNNT